MTTASSKDFSRSDASRPREWFERWFGEEYVRLYPHRDAAQASAQTAALLRAAASSGAPVPQKVLDIGCGAGRHLQAFRALGVPSVGVDLSPVLLRAARAAGCDAARADMRRLPFADGTFDLAACFFTSFGYFETPEEDAEALREFVRTVKPRGLLFLDLPDPDHITRNLVPAETLEAGGRRVEIARRIEGDRVVKRIRILAASGEGTEAKDAVYEERVRLHSRASLEPMLAERGLETVTVLGDENGSVFQPGTSPRMSLLLRTSGGQA